MNMSDDTLNGLTILITRPLELAKQLAHKAEQRGARSIIYPVISIEAPENTEQRDRLLKSIADFDIAIFISPTAVNKTFEHITSIPDQLQVAVIGRSTQAALLQFKVAADIIPEGYNSEALLQHPQLQSDKIKGKAIIIFRGVGGRELLGDSLTKRGGKISYAEMYRRACPRGVTSLSDEQLDEISIITTSSNEGLQNLFDMTSNTGRLVQKPVLVPGIRGRQLANKLGFTEVIQAENATDDATIRALLDWTKTLKSTV